MISCLSNTYGSFRRVPLSKLFLFQNELFSLISENKSLYHKIASLLRKDLDFETKEILRYMFKYYNMLLLILLYCGHDFDVLK